jgi:hypothetical protein
MAYGRNEEALYIVLCLAHTLLSTSPRAARIIRTGEFFDNPGGSDYNEPIFRNE